MNKVSFKRKIFLTSFFLITLYNYTLFGQKIVTLDTIGNTVYLGEFKLKPPSFFISKYTYDPLIDKYIYTTKAGEIDVGIPLTLTPSRSSSFRKGGISMPAPLSTIQLTPLRMNSEGTTTKSEGKPLIRIGLVGCGRIGLVHLAAIAKAQGVKVTMVSNPTISKAESAAAMYNVPEFTSDADEVITSPNVDAVWICSPSSLHASQIKLAAANKKDVFCEKPVATDLPETVEAINACEEAGVKLMIGLQRRFDPNFLRIKSGIEKKEIGETIVVKLCSRDPAPPPISYVKGGGGIFADMAVHDLDMGRFLIGDDPIEILAVGSTHIDKEILELEEPAERYDTASIIVKYPRGVMCHIDVCRQSSYGYDQRAEVLGTGGMLATENMYPNTAKLYTPSFTGNADLPFDFFLEVSEMSGGENNTH